MMEENMHHRGTEGTETDTERRDFFPEITEAVIGAAIEVHRTLGPGLLESVYETAICHELALREIPFRRQVEFPMAYKGVNLDQTFRIDLIVADSVIVELKSVDAIDKLHEAQILTYLRLSGIKIGLLLNFNVRYLKNGIRRLAL
jgi:GxxExxY protein